MFKSRKINIQFVLVFLFVITLRGQIKHGLRDDTGRHIVPRGFVVNTNDHLGEVFFNSNDYQRMVRLGANIQVVRLELGKLGDFAGGSLNENYLKKLDTLVSLGQKSSIRTIFKMTVYGVDSFIWEDFWQNKQNEQDNYIMAWRVIWKKFASNPIVLGYDIVNEPRKLTMDISYKELTDKYLIPLYQRIIDESQKIDPDKLILIQSIFMNKGEGIDNNQYAEIATPVNRNTSYLPRTFIRIKSIISFRL